MLRGLCAVVAVVVGIVGGVVSAAEEVAPDPAWHADAVALRERVERLAEAKALDAAAGVLEELGRRPGAAGGHLDRARYALAKALVAADRSDEAEAVLAAVTWTDKRPERAADLVALRLAIHWRGVRDRHGNLRSGVVLPHEVDGSMAAYARRRDQQQAFVDLERGGLAMLHAEGEQPSLPVDEVWRRALSWAYGQGPEPLPAEAKDAGLALALGRLALEEHELPTALAWAEVLQERRAGAVESLVEDLALWRERREAMRGRLALWDEPGVEARVQALLTAWPAAAARAKARATREEDLQGFAASVAPTPHGVDATEVVIEGEVEEEPSGRIDADLDEDVAVVLALDHHHLRCTATATTWTSAQKPVVTLDSAYAGRHRLACWRLADAAAYAAWCDAPRRELLGAQPAWEEDLDPETSVSSDRIVSTRHRLEQAFPEGVYALTVSVRGAPVVAVGAFQVCDADVQIITHRDGVLGLVADRRSGQILADEAVHLVFTRQVSAEEAAGAVWTSATPAWREGFRAGYTGDGFLGRLLGDETESAAGKAAGEAAALATVQRIEAERSSSAQGLIDAAPPADWTGPWSVRAAVGRSGASLACRADQGEQGAMALKVLAWGDRPFVRPGETLGWRALLRRHDGDRWSVPSETMEVRVVLSAAGGEQVLFQERRQVGGDGSLHGSVVIPPDAGTGRVRIRLGAPGGSLDSFTLAEVGRAGLPALQLALEGPPDDQVRAGEAAALRLRVRDRNGQPLAGVPVGWYVAGSDGVDELPAKTTGDDVTDADGFAQVRVTTLSDKEGTYVVTGEAVHAGESHRLRRSIRAALLPFPVEVNLLDRRVNPGGMVHAELRLPRAARIGCRLVVDGRPSEDIRRVEGGGEAWVPVTLPVPREARSSLRLRCFVDGAQVEHALELLVAAPATEGLGLTLERSILDPGEDLPVVVQVDRPGVDVLVMGTAHGLHLRHRLRLSEAATSLTLPVLPDWAPDLHLRALAYLPGRGFVITAAKELRIRPIDRLLRVEAEGEVADWRPGAEARLTLTVRNWRGEPVGGAHLSVGVVDERVYAIAEDETPDLWRYFHDHQRGDRARIGQEETVPTLDEVLWRSVIRRHGDGMYGCRSGGGKRRAVGRYGGAKGSLAGRAQPFLAIDDARIFWQGDLISDANGRAVVRVQLPDQAGSWRLTARANDVSAAVLVGEVRQRLVASAPLHAHLNLPPSAAAGETLAATVAIHNRSAVIQDLRLGDGPTAPRIQIPAGHRQTVPLTLTAPAGGSGSLVERDGVLGWIASLVVPLHDGQGLAGEARGRCFIRAPGTPQHWRAQVVAGADGVVPLGLPVVDGAAVALTLRAWGGGRERALDHLQDRRDQPGFATLQALLQGEGQRVSWARLGGDAASRLARQVAWRQGAGDLPEDRIADYLGWRLAFLAGTEAPDQPRDAVEAIAARRLVAGPDPAWRAAVDAHCRSDAPVHGLACLADAAVLTGDPSSAVLLAALARCSWQDAFVGALAILHLSEAEPAEDAALSVVAGEPLALASGTWQSWTGIAPRGFALRARPGAVVEVDLLVQASLALPALDLAFAQFDQGAWWPRPAQELRPHLPTLVHILGPAVQDERIQVVVPPTLRPTEVPSGRDGTIQRRRWVGTSAVADALALRDADARRLRFAQGRLETVAVGDLVQAAAWTEVGPSGVAAWADAGGVTLGFRSAAGGAGSLQVIRCDAFGPTAMATVDTRVQAGPSPAPQPEVGAHPRTVDLLRLLDAADTNEGAWLLAEIRADDDLDRLDRFLAASDGTGSWPIAAACTHPGAARIGHPVQAALLRWRGNPLERGIAALRDEVDGPVLVHDLDDLISLRRAVEDRLVEVDRALARPMPVQQVPTLRALAEAAQAEGMIAEGSLDDWLWTQDLEVGAVERWGGPGLRGWARFLGEQLGLNLTLPVSPPQVDPEVVGGPGLGRLRLSRSGVVIVRTDEAYALQVLRPHAAATHRIDVSLVDTPLADAIAWLRTEHGVPVTVADAGLAETAVTCEMRAVAVETLLGWLATQVGGTLRPDAAGWVIR